MWGRFLQIRFHKNIILRFSKAMNEMVFKTLLVYRLTLVFCFSVIQWACTFQKHYFHWIQITCSSIAFCVSAHCFCKTLQMVKVATGILQRKHFMTRIKQLINFKYQLTCFVELIHFCNAFHRTGQNARAPCVSAHFMNASSPDSLAGKRPSLKNMSRDRRTCLNCTTAVVSSSMPVYCLASSFACEGR